MFYDSIGGKVALLSFDRPKLVSSDYGSDFGSSKEGSFKVLYPRWIATKNIGLVKTSKSYGLESSQIWAH